MLSKIVRYVRRHHIGFIALAVALTGTAYAVDGIGPRQIKPNAVRGFHIARGHVGGNNLGELRVVQRRTDTGTAYAVCPKNHRVISGGGFVVGGAVSDSSVAGGRAWVVRGTATDVGAIAICLKRTPGRPRLR